MNVVDTELYRVYSTLAVHVRVEAGYRWVAWIPLGYPFHLSGKAGDGDAVHGGGALVSLQVNPVLAQDPRPGLVDILFRRLEELLTKDLPGLQHLRLEGLLLE